jgi:hypothetical protein
MYVSGGSSREFQVGVLVVRAAQDAPDEIGDGKSGDTVQNLITVSGAGPTLRARVITAWLW